jgi:UV DNA damage endonuclease
MKLGLVCISEILKKRDKSLSFKTMTRSHFLKGDRAERIKELSRRTLHNAKLLGSIVDHCYRTGIAHYRVSSTLMPLLSDETLELSFYDLPLHTEIARVLEKAGEFARSVGISLSMHPDQFNVLASYNSATVHRSINELNHQSHILDLLGAATNYSSPMCLHLNCSPKLERESLKEYRARFFEALSQCDPGVRARLVLENEDKGFWNAENLYEVFGDSIPLVYDNLHDMCNPSGEGWAEKYVETWGDFEPVFHWSEGIGGGRSHTDYASHVPEIVTLLGERVTWEVELKAKDHAISAILSSQS